uniref:Uncharacterized protein n=1 Tax=Setaria digitata TaxID=48799 RepID=A0A915PYN9_9BILA
MVGRKRLYQHVSNSPNLSTVGNQYRRGNLYPDLVHLRRRDSRTSDDDNVSYESDHDDYDDSLLNASNSSASAGGWILPKKFWFISIIFAIVLTAWFLSRNSSEITALKSVLKKNFTNEYRNGTNTKAVLRLIGEKWVSEEPTEPYVVLITGRKANMLADALGDVFSIVKGEGAIDKIFCNEYKERQLLEGEVTKSLSKQIRSVILYGIDKLRGRAPLYLHTISDPDHSPFPSALILLTVNIFFGSHPICEDVLSSARIRNTKDVFLSIANMVLCCCALPELRFSSYLLNVWNSDYIGEEQIRPILSRISSFLICLED